MAAALHRNRSSWIAVALAGVMLLGGLYAPHLQPWDLPTAPTTGTEDLQVPGGAGGMVPLDGPGEQLPSGAALVRSLSPTQVIDFYLEIALPQTSTLNTYEQELETPGSPLFHQTLTIQQFLQRFGPPTASVNGLLSYLRTEGLRVLPTSGPLVYRLSGPAAAVDRAFDFTLGIYALDGSHGLAPSNEPSLPAAFAGDVQSLPGVDRLDGPRPADLFSSPLPGTRTSAPTCSSPTCITPAVMRTFYNESSLLENDSGSDPIGLAEMCDPLEPTSDFLPDVTTFDSYYGLPAPNITFIGDGTSNCSGTGYPGWGEETDLDIQWAHAMAPGAPLVVCQDTTDPGNCDQTFITDGIPIGSNSWGGPWNESSVWAAAMAAGVDLLTASGDKDKYTSNTTPSYPAGYSTGLAIGGTCVDPGAGGVYGSEGGWGEKPCSHSSGEGSGGGCDSLDAPAPYQIGTPGYPGVCTTKQRGIPDLAMDADPSSGVVIVSAGIESEEGGTSLACPMWAAVLSVTFQASGYSGFVDPTIYSFAKGPDASKILHNITTGGNGYAATAGWNPVTGVGTPNIGGLATALATVPQNLSVSVSAAPTVLTVGATVHARALAAHGSSPYTYQWRLNGSLASGAPSSADWNWTPAHPATYHLSVGVTDASSRTANSSAITILVSEPSPNPYTVDFFESPTSCTLSFNGTARADGTSGTFFTGQYAIVAAPCTGYAFHEWNSTGGVGVASGNSASTTATISGNGSLTAWYLKNGTVAQTGTVQFEIFPATCGPITLGGLDEYNGSSGMFPLANYTADAPTCPSHVEPQWSVTGALHLSSATADPTTVSVQGNGTLSVTYSEVPPPPAVYGLRLTVSPVACGPLVFNGTSQTNGSQVSVPASAYPAEAPRCKGYAFSSWEAAGGVAVSSSTSANVTVTVTGNGTLAALYALQHVTPTLSSVTVSPGSFTLSAESEVIFTASPTCSGGACPGGISYAWSITNAIGYLNGSTGSAVSFTAGTGAGNGTLFVNATWSGKTVESSPASITVTSVGNGHTPGESSSPNSSTLTYLVLAAALIAVVITAVLVLRPKRRAPAPQPDDPA